MDFLIITIAALFLIFYFGFAKQSKKRFHLPPGPRNLPIFGSLLSLGAEPHKTFQSWAKLYGPIIYTKFGFTDVVIIDDEKLLRSAFGEAAFAGRMINVNFALTTGGSPGLAGADPPTAIEQRRVTLRNLRDYGMGTTSIETLILDEVKELADWIKINEGQPLNLTNRFIVASANPLLVLLSGKRFAQNDATVHKILLDANQAVFETTKSSALLTYFPYLHSVLPKFFRKRWYDSLDMSAPFRQIFTNLLQSRTADGITAEHNDVLDALLSTAKHTTDPNSMFSPLRSAETVTSIMAQLYGTAEATTSITLSWMILLLARFPKVQAKLHKELDDNIGQENNVTLADRSRLPFAQAVITEILRYSSVFPIGSLHKTMVATCLGGYDIRKGTTVIGNLFSIHYNTQIWGDPQNFRPERFLSPDGKTIIKTTNVIAFGTGRRNCIGESLARDTIFLFLSSMCKEFLFWPDPLNPIPSVVPKEFGFFREPTDFKVVFHRRSV